MSHDTTWGVVWLVFTKTCILCKTQHTLIRLHTVRAISDRTVHTQPVHHGLERRPNAMLSSVFHIPSTTSFHHGLYVALAIPPWPKLCIPRSPSMPSRALDLSSLSIATLTSSLLKLSRPCAAILDLTHSRRSCLSRSLAHCLHH